MCTDRSLVVDVSTAVKSASAVSVGLSSGILGIFRMVDVWVHQAVESSRHRVSFWDRPVVVLIRRLPVLAHRLAARLTRHQTSF